MNNFSRAKVARFLKASLANSSLLPAIFALKLTLFARGKPHPGVFRGSLSMGLGMGLSLITSTISAEVQLIDGIAAVVNEDIILLSELRSEVKVIHQQLTGCLKIF